MRTPRPSLARPWWLLPLGRWDSRWWVAVGLALTGLEYVAGPQTDYPVAHAIPVILAAWYSGRQPALTLALAVALARILLHVTLWTPPDALAGPITATLFRGALIALIGLWFARLSEHEHELYRHVERLEGLLPICSFCKRIRNDAGTWESLEGFISTRSEAQFSHGVCPPCGEANYPGYDLTDDADGQQPVQH